MPPEFVDKPWLCSMADFIWPKGKPGGTLSMLALDNGLTILGDQTHRALSDCILIARLFDKMGDALPAMFEKAMRPKGLFCAIDEHGRKFWNLSEQEQSAIKQLRIDAGFRWNRLVPKAWSRRMAIEDVATLPFECERIEE